MKRVAAVLGAMHLTLLFVLTFVFLMAISAPISEAHWLEKSNEISQEVSAVLGALASEAKVSSKRFAIKDLAEEYSLVVLARGFS